ncbi:MAG: hypothetical protein H6948_01075 [Zoogloeaceae bacterium]|nr:hypothetical protein [Zoogloeaceae bacterium]
MSKETVFPGPDLLRHVRAGLVLRGTSLRHHAETVEGVTIQTARINLLGQRNGPKARALRARLAEAAGVSYQEAA